MTESLYEAHLRVRLHFAKSSKCDIFGAGTLQFELGVDFLMMHLPTTFHHPKFNRSEVIVLTKKQTSGRCWKYPHHRLAMKNQDNKPVVTELIISEADSPTLHRCCCCCCYCCCCCCCWLAVQRVTSTTAVCLAANHRSFWCHVTTH